MEWTQVFVILGVFIGGFLYLASKIDKVREDLGNQIRDNSKDTQKVRTDLFSEIQKNREELLWIKFRLDPHEHMVKKDEEIKEN